jgi:peptidoglycan/xylan/chitin deacetylase (PgdA/CDA1 family)
MGLNVQISPTFQKEKAYVLSVLLGEFLGLDYQMQVVDDATAIIITNAERQLSIADCFFHQAETAWLQLASLPCQPLQIWDLNQTSFDFKTVTPQLPVIYGQDPNQSSFFENRENFIHLGLDIFGSAFFMLTRYEEVVKPDRDQCDRFPASASLAAQEHFLDRPIINEYLEVLWGCMQALWPGLQRKNHTYEMVLSHDVDEPFRFAFSGVRRLLQRCAGDILYRKSVWALLMSLRSWGQVKWQQRYDCDPNNTFDLIMDISEQHNVQSAFYFITDHSAGIMDGDYHMEHPLIRQLLRKIHTRGHEIGLHTSYNTYLDPAQTLKEFQILTQACAEEGIYQDTWGGRQHYLRWLTPTTFQNWDAAGLQYDSTLTYAEQIGFRCGTCYEFPVFDLATSTTLRLRERPLCIMEVSVTRVAYMGLNIADGTALSAMVNIKRNCQLFNGKFTLLWHNVSLVEQDELALYREIVCA